MRTWYVARREMIQLLRDRRALGAFVSMPVIMVLLFGYAWFRQTAGDAPVPIAAPTGEAATKADLGGLVDHLVRELDAVGFFRAEERRASLIRTITVMLERRHWTAAEVQLMRGIIKELAGGRKARQKNSTSG